MTSNALAGHTDLLKERLVGIQVFGRAPDYDTTTDPIVRVTAAEIRKRLEQYYHEPEHAGELKIVLPSGSYIPQFSMAGATSSHQVHSVAQPALESDRNATQKRYWLSAIIAGIVALSLVAAVVFWRNQDDRAFTQFWRPMLSSASPILFCVADQSQYTTMILRDAADPSRQQTISDTMTAVVIDDVPPLVNVAGLLHSNQRPYRLKNEAATSLTDLRQSPTVLVGAFDNEWTLRETAGLRFHFGNEQDMSRLWIEDRANPGKVWGLDRTAQRTGVYKDYAIVARFVDPDTGQLAIVAAGIARGGTMAAGEFLVDEHQFAELAKHAPHDWWKKDMEFVIETQVIDGRSGPPHVVAEHYW